MKIGFNPLLTKTLKGQESIRNEILQVLEQNTDGLPVTTIFRHLMEHGHIITPQAISQNLSTLETLGLVWKTKRFNAKVKRELWYYFSLGPFFNSILADVKKELIALIVKSVEKNTPKAGQFGDFRVLQNIFENTISFAAQSVIFGEELYDELSKQKYFRNVALLIKDYTTAVSNVYDAIIESKLGYGERRVCLGLPASLALGQPFDMAKMIVNGAINGKKNYLNALFFLQKKVKGEMSKRIETSLKWVQNTSKLPLTNKSEE